MGIKYCIKRDICHTCHTFLKGYMSRIFQVTITDMSHFCDRCDMANFSNGKAPINIIKTYLGPKNMSHYSIHYFLFGKFCHKPILFYPSHLKLYFANFSIRKAQGSKKMLHIFPFLENSHSFDVNQI